MIFIGVAGLSNVIVFEIRLEAVVRIVRTGEERVSHVLAELHVFGIRDADDAGIFEPLEYYAFNSMLLSIVSLMLPKAFELKPRDLPSSHVQSWWLAHGSSSSSPPENILKSTAAI